MRRFLDLARTHTHFEPMPSQARQALHDAGWDYLITHRHELKHDAWWIATIEKIMPLLQEVPLAEIPTTTRTMTLDAPPITTYHGFYDVDTITSQIEQLLATRPISSKL